MSELEPGSLTSPEESKSSVHRSLSDLQERVDALLEASPESLERSLEEGESLSQALSLYSQDHLAALEQQELEASLESCYKKFTTLQKLDAIHNSAWHEWHSSFPRLVAQFYNDPDSSIRAEAAASAPSFHPYCSRLIDDPDPEVRAGACRQVFFGFGSGWRPYVRKLIEDPSPEVRQALANNRVLPHFFPIEFRLLREDREPGVRVVLAKNPAVARLYPDWVRAAASDADSGVRSSLATNPEVPLRLSRHHETALRRW